jgi:curved DNA-binding protein
MGGSPDGFDFSQWAAAGGPGGGYRTVNVDLEDLFGGGSFSEFFSTIFGGSRGRNDRNPEGMFRNQHAQAPGRDIEHKVEITLEEAFHGTERTLFQADGRQIRAKIPPGAKTGSKIRLRGKGQPGLAGPGDLFLLIRVIPHETFRRHGNNLSVEVPVDVLTAILGGKVSVPTLNGSVKLTIPPGTQGGRTFRLKNKGMPDLRAKGTHGDLLARVRIQVPEPDKLGEKERRLYEQLAHLAEAQGTRERMN